jgi:hypothetical protein
VSLLPCLFDCLLLIGSALFACATFRAIAAVQNEAAALPGVTFSVHRYGGTQFDLDGREIGHVHGNGVLDLRFPRSVRDQLVRAGRAQVHHTFPDSGWVSVELRCQEDVQAASYLLGVAVAQMSD